MYCMEEKIVKISQLIKKFAKQSLRKNKVLAKSFSWVYPLWMKKNKIEDLKNIIDRYVTADRKKDRTYMKKVTYDIVFSHLYYRIDADEYFRYRFENLSDCGRKEYVGVEEILEKCEKIVDPRVKFILRDKYKSYVLFRELYKRDVIQLRDESDYTKFC